MEFDCFKNACEEFYILVVQDTVYLWNLIVSRTIAHEILHTYIEYIYGICYFLIEVFRKQTNKQTSWPLGRKRTIPTERPLLVDKFSINFWDRGVSRGQRGGSPTAFNLSFIDRSRYFYFK
jgi:hypothetical protein